MHIYVCVHTNAYTNILKHIKSHYYKCRWFKVTYLGRKFYFTLSFQHIPAKTKPDKGRAQNKILLLCGITG